MAHIARNKDGRFQNREAGEDIEYHGDSVVENDDGDDGENGGNADDDGDGDVEYGNDDHDDDVGEDGDEKEGVVSPHVSSVNSTNKYPLPSFWAVVMLGRKR